MAETNYISTMQSSAYQQSAQDVLKHFEASEQGLSREEHQKRLNQYGKNILPKGKKVTLTEIIIRQFKSPLIYVLLVAGILAFFLDKQTDAIFIGVILLVNTLIGTIQEWKAETSALALQQMIQVNAHVKRNGKLISVAAEDLVPGDIVVLESGHKVPADLRMIRTNNLSVEEAPLTGESVAVTKDPQTIEESDVPLGERYNMAFAGTTVMSGRGTGVVTATGEQTEIGGIAASLRNVEATKAPLVERMELFAQRISIVTLVACVFLGIVGYINGIGLAELFFFVIAIAVSAIPEGLPISMTVGLSIGTSRMAKRNVIVRKLTAVEGLGSCTMIATDKTGTLTVDQQTVRTVVLNSGEKYHVSGEGYNGEGDITGENGEQVTCQDNGALASLVDVVSICNEASLYPENNGWMHNGDAVDIAMLGLAYKSGKVPDEIKESVTVEGEIPYESEKQYAAVYFRRNGKLYVAVKGSMERLMEHVEQDDGMGDKALELAKSGHRVIGVAWNEVDEVDLRQLPSLKIAGAIGLIDPVRKETPAAIKECHVAGIGVSMITGDHPATALAIAKGLGIAKDENHLITGKELEKLGDPTTPAFYQQIKDKRVFARVTPHQKQQLVIAFKQAGHFVAVTGDGVNDAPALKAGNIGVAMGSGTDVAKDVASIIVADNNFASIAAGVEEGRFTYSNLRKIIYLLISTGAAEVLMVLAAMLSRMPLPFLPVQILWLNLVTNGIQDKTLALEKGERFLMKMPPRDSSEGVFNQLMVRQVLCAAFIMAACTLGLWYHLLYNMGWEEPVARNAVLLLMVLMQNVHVLNCRSEVRSIFRIPFKYNPYLIGGILLAQGVHILSMQLPVMQTLLSVEPVALADWGKLLATAALMLVGMEIFKYVYARRHGVFDHG